MKNIQVSDLVYEMVLELSKKERKKSKEWIEETVKTIYNKNK